MFEWVAEIGWPIFVNMAIKSFYVMLLGGIAAYALRRSSASARYITSTITMSLLWLLPFTSFIPSLWMVPLGSPHTLTVKDVPVIVAPPPPSSLEFHSASRASNPLKPPPVQKAGVLGTDHPLWTRKVEWRVWVVFAWLLVAAVLMIRISLDQLALRRFSRQCPLFTDARLFDLTTVLASKLKYRRRIPLLASDLMTPMTWSASSPVIVLPRDAITWPEERLRSVLLHEIAHIVRGDFALKLTNRIYCALYWFNPFISLFASKAQRDSERACDDLVLLAGVNAVDYAEELLNIAGSIHTAPLHSSIALFQPSTLGSRIEAILSKTIQRGEMSKKMRFIILLPLNFLIIFSYLIGFAIPMPPNRAVWMDPESFRIVKAANSATRAVQSLQATLHASIRFSYQPTNDDDFQENLVLQRPNYARITESGQSGFLFVSNGTKSVMVNNDGSGRLDLPVNRTGSNMTSDDESNPFVRYFYKPAFHRLGIDLIDSIDFYRPPYNGHLPIPVNCHYLGRRLWHGKPYQVVEFVRTIMPGFGYFHNTTTVYFGQDHLVHRIIGKSYFKEGVRVDDVYLTGLEINKSEPLADFALPHK